MNEKVDRCHSWKQDAVQDKAISKLMSELEKRGFPLTIDEIKCVFCKESAHARFQPTTRALDLCANHLDSPEQLNDAMRHEVSSH